MSERGVAAKVVSKATGIPTSTLSEWTGGRQPKLSDDVLKLARFFGVSIEYLITGKEPINDVMSEVLESLDDGFVTVHQGVYRFKIEKLTSDSKKKRDKK